MKKGIKLLLILAAIIFGISFSAMAQDIIVFTDGSIENAKIIEVGDDVIKYKKWDKQDGPTYSVYKTRLLSINYQDGTKENFANQQNQYENRQQNSSKANNPISKQKPAYEQKPDYGISIHAGAAFPAGSFGDVNMVTEEGDSYPDNLALFGGGIAGGAATGFNIGVKGKFALKKNGLGIIATGDFIYNGLKSDVRDCFGKLNFDKIPKYINIPIIVGLNYKYDINEKYAVWGEGGIGLDIRIITKASWEESYEEFKIERKIKYNIGASFALQIGGGIMLNEKFSLGIHYYWLGTSKIKGNITSIKNGKSESEDVSKKLLSTSMIMLRLGYHL